MSDDAVWSPGEDAPPTSSPPGTAYGQGMWVNQAFSPDVAFRLGFALLRERPGLMLGLGFALWLFTNLPQLLSIPGDLTVGVLQGVGEENTANVVDLFNNLILLGVYIVVFPFQWYVTAGGLRAIAQHVETGESDASLVWNGGTNAAWTIAYRILFNLIVFLVIMAVLAPFSGVAAVLGWNGVLAGAFVALGVGVIACLIAYVWVGLPLTLGTLACAIDGVTASEGLGIGWQAGHGARATLVVFGLVFGILSVIGACFFCVGQIPVMSLALGAAGGGWVLYSRPQETLAASPFLKRNLPDLT